MYQKTRAVVFWDSQSCEHSLANEHCQLARIFGFALPYDHNSPAKLPELCAHANIASIVGSKLVGPERRRRRGRLRAAGVSVPEASVHEQHNVSSWKDEIRCARKITSMEAEAKSDRVSRLSNSVFRGRVFAPNSRHQP